MASVNINFTASASVNYVITYKKTSDTTWTTPSGNPTSTSPFTVNGLDDNTQYDFKVQSNCGIVTVQYTTGTSASTIWIEDTFTCEQDTPFTLSGEYDGFSSPFGIYYHPTQAKFYVVDCDDVNGTFIKFDPATITAYSDVTHISGSTTTDINGYVIDETNNRIISVGDNSSGALVLDMSTDTVSTLTYGTNQGGNGGASLRLPVGLSENYFYAFNKTGTSQVRIYNRSDLSLSSTITISTIPSATTYLSGGYSLWFVGSEIWVSAASRSNSSVARYSSDFTTLNGTITLSGAATAFSGTYWQQGYLDTANNFLYLGDSGSKILYVINITTNAVISATQLKNFKGKSYSDFVISKSDLDGQIYAQVRGLNSLSDSSPVYKLYKIDASTGQIIFIYPDTEGASLTTRTGTNEQWGVSKGLTRWDSPNTGWGTDGKILKYS